MKRKYLGQPKSVLAAALFGTALVGVTISTPALGQLEEASRVLEQTTKAGQDAQRRINQIDDQTSEIVEKYRATISHLEKLREYNQGLRELIADQEKEIARYRRDIENVQGIEREVLPLMTKMMTALEQFIDGDLPFWQAERAKRVATLKGLLGDSSVSAAEKYRKVLEAYQIENDYGRTMEAYSSAVDFGDGVEREVTFLKLGRVALYAQTADRTTTKIFNAETRAWDDANDQREQVATGIKMANENIPPDLFTIKVPGAKNSSN